MDLQHMEDEYEAYQIAHRKRRNMDLPTGNPGTTPAMQRMLFVPLRLANPGPNTSSVAHLMDALIQSQCLSHNFLGQDLSL